MLETYDAAWNYIVTQREESNSAEEGTDNVPEEKEPKAASGDDHSAMPVYLYDRCRRWLDGCPPLDRKLFMEKLQFIRMVAAGHSKHEPHGKQLRGGDRRVRVWETQLDKARRILWVRHTIQGGIEVYVHMVEENHDRISRPLLILYLRPPF